MEFETPENLKSPVPEEERIAAETRKRTLKPMNPFLKPEDLPDPVIVNQAPANLQRDTENTSSPDSLVLPTPSSQQVRSKQPKTSTIVASVGGICLLVAGLYIFLVG